MDSLPPFQCMNAGWQRIIRQNQRRTILVIITYLLTYGALGLLFDLYHVSHIYPSLPLSTLMVMFLSFQIVPIFTLLAMILAIMSVCGIFAYYDTLMLLGTHYFEITPNMARSSLEQQIYRGVEEIRVAASMSCMPKIFIIEANYMNAFATGISEKSAMIAITRGLAEKLTHVELRAVLAHEFSHIRYLDIRLTLFAVVLSNLILMFIDVLFSKMIFKFGGREGVWGKNANVELNFYPILFFRTVLPLITLWLLLFLNRKREYRADSGALALLHDNASLAEALLKIQRDHEVHRGEYQVAYMYTPHEQVRREAYIYDPAQAWIGGFGCGGFFAKHPSVLKRLKALRFQDKK